MRTIITNWNNLDESDITEVVTRVKLLIVNSNNEILLGYSHNTYQFPGGHVEKGEKLIETINREIEEEVGIKLNMTKATPFAVSIGYWKDHPFVGNNRKTIIYFYKLKTDEKPSIENTNYTEHEKEGKFELRYIPLATFEEELKCNVDKYGDTQGIAREMLEVFKIYNKEN